MSPIRWTDEKIDELIRRLDAGETFEALALEHNTSNGRMWTIVKDYERKHPDRARRVSWKPRQPRPQPIS